MDGEKKNPASTAAFHIEHMAMLLNVGRLEEAAESYKRAIESARDAAAEIDRLREITIDTSPLEQLAKLTCIANP